MIVLMNNRILVVFIILVLCAGCFHETSSTPPPGIKKSLQEKQMAEFRVVLGEAIQIHNDSAPQRNSPAQSVVFVDELHGYGLSAARNGSASLLQTRDGGINWNPQKGLPGVKTSSTISFLDARIGWMLMSDTAGRKSELRLTSDGGQTWEVIAKDLPGLEESKTTVFFRFFDRQRGLIAAQDEKELVLLRTLDGGITWLASNRITQPGEGTMTFLSLTEGWMIGTSLSQSSNEKRKDIVTLYRMRDGESWEEAGEISTNLLPQAISFADKEHGFMLLQTNLVSPGNQGERMLLRTVDGGKTWSQHAFPDSFLPADAGLQFSFITPSSGWLWNARHVWRTKDGGLSWHMLKP